MVKTGVQISLQAPRFCKYVQGDWVRENPNKTKVQRKKALKDKLRDVEEAMSRTSLSQKAKEVLRAMENVRYLDQDESLRREVSALRVGHAVSIQNIKYVPIETKAIMGRDRDSTILAESLGNPAATWCLISPSKVNTQMINIDKGASRGRQMMMMLKSIQDQRGELELICSRGPSRLEDHLGYSRGSASSILKQTNERPRLIATKIYSRASLWI